MTERLWINMTEEQLLEERKRIQKDQAAHTGEKGNGEK